MISGQLTTPDAGLPTAYEPRGARERDAIADAAISCAKSAKNWPALEEAAELKIAELKQLVAWWTENVRGKGKHKRGQLEAKIA